MLSTWCSIPFEFLYIKCKRRLRNTCSTVKALLAWNSAVVRYCGLSCAQSAICVQQMTVQYTDSQQSAFCKWQLQSAICIPHMTIKVSKMQMTITVSNLRSANDVYSQQSAFLKSSANIWSESEAKAADRSAVQSIVEDADRSTVQSIAKDADRSTVQRKHHESYSHCNHSTANIRYGSEIVDSEFRYTSYFILIFVEHQRVRQKTEREASLNTILVLPSACSLVSCFTCSGWQPLSLTAASVHLRERIHTHADRAA